LSRWMWLSTRLGRTMRPANSTIRTVGSGSRGGPTEVKRPFWTRRSSGGPSAPIWPYGTVRWNHQSSCQFSSHCVPIHLRCAERWVALVSCFSLIGITRVCHRNRFVFNEKRRFEPCPRTFAN
jgi:hypothetical protein